MDDKQQEKPEGHVNIGKPAREMARKKLGPIGGEVVIRAVERLKPSDIRRFFGGIFGGKRK